MVPSGTFQVGQSAPGGIDLASQIGFMNVQTWEITGWDVICALGTCNELPEHAWVTTPYLNLLAPGDPPSGDSGLGSGSGKGPKQITRHFGQTITCASSASQVMALVEANFSRFGNYSRLGGA